MNTPFFIAKRYLFAKKSTNAIHIISGISMLGVFIGSMALVVILSVFNGFEEMILKMYHSISPEITILPAQGKVFNPQSEALRSVTQDARVAYYVLTLQENAVVKNQDKQSVALVKGVSDSFLKNPHLDSILVDGSFQLERNLLPSAVFGIDIQSLLSINVSDPLNSISVYSPRKQTKFNSVNPYDDFVISNITASGVFNVDQFYNNQVIVPLSFARTLFQDSVNVSSIELFTKESIDGTRFQEAIQQKLGNQFKVKNRLEQNQLLYQILRSEKWAIYLILTFVLMIAIFNIIGSLTMLVIDKVKDIAILSSLGASKSLIQRIFLLEGIMITTFGCIFGLCIGGVFSWGQQKYGWIKMGAQSFVEAFPVQMKWTDFVLVFLTVLLISFLASSIAASLSVKRLLHLKEDL